MRKQLLLLIVILFITVIGQGANWYVDPLGTNDGSHGTTTGTGAFKTIQYAINAAAAGDVINVATGLYTEALTIGKNLQLSGAGPSNSMISAFGLNSASITVTGGNVKIRNFGIREDNTASKPCISVTGGILDAGTTADHGNNRFYVVGAGSAIDNAQLVDLHAEYNDWGSAKGPAVSTNPGGDGGSITGAGYLRVFYNPWGGGPVTTISPVTVCAEAVTVDIPVTVSHCTGIGSFSLSFGYTTAQLTNPMIVSRNAAFDLPGHVWNPFYYTSNPNGTYKISGFGTLSSDGITLADGSTLFTLRFTIGTVTSTANITFNDNAQGTACEFTGVAPDYAPFGDIPTATNYINGDVTINRLTSNTIGTAQTICSGSTVSLTGSTVTGGTISYQWQSSNSETGTYTNVSPGGTTKDYISGSLTTDTWFRRLAASLLNGVSCISTSTPVKITVDAAPVPANAGSDQSQCNSSSFTLAGNTASVGQGTWTVQSGTATISSLHSATSGVTGIISGSSATLRWTIVNGTCSSSDEVLLTNDISPVAANAGSDQTQCGNGNFTMAGNTASVGQGTWTVQNGTATITSLHSATSGVTGVPAGSSAVLRWTITNGTCSSSDEVTLTHNATPDPANAGADQSQYNSGNFTLAGNSASAGTGTWTVESGTATVTSLHLPTSGVTGVPVGSSVVLSWTILNGTCSSTDDVTLTNKPLLNISGNFTYYNLDNTPLQSNITVGLFQGGTQLGTDYTVTAGTYTFGSLLPGTYEVRAHSSMPVDGSVNSTDAAQLNNWSVFYPAPIEKVRFYAGDVAGGGQYTPVNNVLQSTDAYRIQLHFVDETPFDRPNAWTFWKAGETISTNPDPVAGVLYPTIVVTDGADVTLNLYGLCTGDYNRSFNPTLGKSAGSTLRLSYGGTKQVARNQEFDLPVTLVNSAVIGAVSLVLDYPGDLVTVQDVLFDGEGGQFDWAVKDNQLRIGWNSRNPLSFAAGDVVINLKLTTTPTFTQGNVIRFALAGTPQNELADGKFTVIDDAELNVDVVEASSVGIDENETLQKLTISNYPNPFSNSTMMSYTLPYDGMVTLEIRNLVGQLVKTIVNNRESKGSHSVKLQAWNLEPGVYTATITLEGKADECSGTGKLIINR